MIHFRPEEFGPRAAEIHPELIAALDQLRGLIGMPIVIHPDPMGQEGRAATSQHPLGRAVDCHVVGMDLLDFWLWAERLAAFTGIGVYPDTVGPLAWTHPGLHLDTRVVTCRARWWRDGQGNYWPLNATFLHGLPRRWDGH